MKDNKLLAEYLKMFTPRIGTWRSFEPDEDWNDIMLVVEKIEEEVEAINITKDFCSIWLVVPEDYDEDSASPAIHCSGDKTIEAVYNACVEYIKQK